MLFIAPHSFANGLQTWSDRSIGLTNDLYAIAFGNERFVAVGQDGIVFVSTNGVQWIQINSPAAATLRGVAYGGRTFVAVGAEGTILASSDATVWVPRPSGSTGQLSAVVYGPDQFVAVGPPDAFGSDAVILTSPDGLNWTRRESGHPDPLHAITYGGGIYLAVGHFNTLISSNGADWLPTSNPNNAPVYGIAHGNGRFVSAASDVYTPGHPFSVSYDASYWISTSAGTEGTAFGITFASGIFAAVGGLTLDFRNPTNQLAASADGEHWTTYGIAPVPELRAIAYGAGTFVTVGPGGAIFQSGSVIQPTLHIERHPGTLQLTVTGDPACTYRLQSSTNLVTGDWTDFLTLTNIEQPITLAEPDSSNSSHQFFRAVLP